MSSSERSLEVQRAEFAAERGLAMPLAGTIAWAAVGVAGLFLHEALGGILFGAVLGLIAHVMISATDDGSLELLLVWLGRFGMLPLESFMRIPLL
jgi:NhaP-type Na+/H+ or K+/H+ antiporter